MLYVIVNKIKDLKIKEKRKRKLDVALRVSSHSSLKVYLVGCLLFVRVRQTNANHNYIIVLRSPPPLSRVPQEIGVRGGMFPMETRK